VNPRPRVTIHYAQTLDGRIATRTGESQWIGSAESLRLAHGLRAEHQAVLVGIGTVLADDPRLTVRHVAGPSPVRVVVDSHLRIPMDARVLADRAAPTIVLTSESAPVERAAAVRDRGGEVVTVATGANGWIDVGTLLRELSQRGLSSVLVEGGARLITSVLRSRAVDRIVVCIAPRICGAGIDAIGDLGIEKLAQTLTFRESAFYPLGRDVIFDGTLA
jgi:5-amino-6-(5-phosphoribosylamino)uracil reductase/diaminohydroxyphosphoribosylaminopyrimidine deaminase/5-amino-6-(5-phosphoribosylamino)uracil reductase